MQYRLACMLPVPDMHAFTQSEVNVEPEETND